MKKGYKRLVIVMFLASALALAVSVVVMTSRTAEEPVARTYGCAVYMEQGCAKQVVADGGEIEIQSGGLLDVKSGAVSEFGGDVRITGSLTVSTLITTSSTNFNLDGNLTSGIGALTVTAGNGLVVSNNITASTNVQVDGALNVDGASTLEAVDINVALTGGTGSELRVNDNVRATGSVTAAIGYISGTLDVVGTSSLAAATTSGALNAGTTLSVTTWFGMAPQDFVLVAGEPITPTGTYMRITSAGVITCSTSRCIVDGSRHGDILILENANAADAITIDGTGGNVECKSDVVLDQDDTLILIWNAADWICLSGYDNS